jgi:flagellar basal body rod protein FlgG
MIKGLYSAASAMLAGLTRQNMLSHNLANVDTPGFKQWLVSLDDFLHTRVSTRPGDEARLPATRVLGDLGLGVETIAPVTDFAEGALRQTGEPLDVAVHGPGFFRVETPNGERYTRDGRFLRDADGALVTVDGYAVLDEAGAPITLPEGAVAIGGDGTLSVNGAPVAQLGLALFAAPETELIRDLPNTFAAAGQPTGTARGVIVQGYVEASNINPAQLMTQMVSVGRAYEAAQQLVQVQDELLGRAISTLGQF